jgi:hypothetical protein
LPTSSRSRKTGALSSLTTVVPARTGAVTIAPDDSVRAFCEHAYRAVSIRANERPAVAGLSKVGGTGLEPVTPSLSIQSDRALVCAGVRLSLQTRAFVFEAFAGVHFMCTLGAHTVHTVFGALSRAVAARVTLSRLYISDSRRLMTRWAVRIGGRRPVTHRYMTA